MCVYIMFMGYYRETVKEIYRYLYIIYTAHRCKEDCEHIHHKEVQQHFVLYIFIEQ